MAAKKTGPRGSVPDPAGGARRFLDAARARNLETATERCGSVLSALEALHPTHDFSPLWEEGTPGGDAFAASFIFDVGRGDWVEPEPKVRSALVAAAYCVEGIKADVAGEERQAWHAALNAERLAGFIAGHRASTAGVDEDEAIKKELRSERARTAATASRPASRTVDHHAVLTEIKKLIREGHSEREARGIVVSRGMASQPTVSRIMEASRKKTIR